MDRKSITDKLMSEVAGVCACQKVRSAARVLTRRYEEALKPTGLTGTQYSMLTVILVTEGRTLTELATFMDIERTTLLRNLKPLERDGLVEVSAEGFRRARTVTASDKGVAIMAKALPLWREVQNSLKAELGATGWKHMQDSMNILGQMK